MGDLCLHLLGCASFASKQFNVAVQQSSSTAVNAVQYVVDFTLFCSQTDIAVLHPKDVIVRFALGHDYRLFLVLMQICGSVCFIFVGPRDFSLYSMQCR